MKRLNVVKANIEMVRRMRKDIRIKFKCLFHLMPMTPRYGVLFYQELRLEGYTPEVIELAMLDDEQFERDCLATEMLAYWNEHPEMNENQIKEIFQEQILALEERFKK